MPPPSRSNSAERHAPGLLPVTEGRATVRPLAVTEGRALSNGEFQDVRRRPFRLTAFDVRRAALAPVTCKMPNARTLLAHLSRFDMKTTFNANACSAPRLETIPRHKNHRDMGRSWRMTNLASRMTRTSPVIS